MNYSLVNPCPDCPFLKEGGIRIHRERAREIAEAVTGNPGQTFWCHQTTHDEDDSEHGAADDYYVPDDNDRHCYGALVFAEKLNSPNQMMRIAERLGMYDPWQVIANTAAAARVFDSIEEMVAGNGNW